MEGLMRWGSVLLMAGWLMAGLPASTDYKLNSYGFGNGGVANSTSTHYGINGTAGEVAGYSASTNYKVGSGEKNVKQANVPKITITNDASWYNKLRVVIDTQNNPTDTLYAVAISTDNFATTKYVQSDFTVGTSLSISNFLNYASWGSSSGVLIHGLTAGTVYSVKATAYHGKYTQSAYGPTSSASTVNPQLSFEIDVAPTDSHTSPPYEVDFGSLLVSTVTDAPSRVWISLDTNGESGGLVYVSGQNGGLKSLLANHTISALTGDLGTLAEGFGLQGASATQTSGGPFTILSPYNGSAGNVGVEDSTIRQIFSTSGAPIVGGRGSFFLVAKTQPLTPASNDYGEILTAIASASF